jgi:hypothetical protein
MGTWDRCCMTVAAVGHGFPDDVQDDSEASRLPSRAAAADLANVTLEGDTPRSLLLKALLFDGRAIIGRDAVSIVGR